MDIDQILEKLKEWFNKVLDALLGPQPEHEAEPIPVPVNDRKYPRR